MALGERPGYIRSGSVSRSREGHSNYIDEAHNLELWTGQRADVAWLLHDLTGTAGYGRWSLDDSTLLGAEGDYPHSYYGGRESDSLELSAGASASIRTWRGGGVLHILLQVSQPGHSYHSYPSIYLEFFGEWG